MTYCQDAWSRGAIGACRVPVGEEQTTVNGGADTLLDMLEPTCLRRDRSCATRPSPIVWIFPVCNLQYVAFCVRLLFDGR